MNVDLVGAGSRDACRCRVACLGPSLDDLPGCRGAVSLANPASLLEWPRAAGRHRSSVRSPLLPPGWLRVCSASASPKATGVDWGFPLGAFAVGTSPMLFRQGKP